MRREKKMIFGNVLRSDLHKGFFDVDKIIKKNFKNLEKIELCKTFCEKNEKLKKSNLIRKNIQRENVLLVHF